MIHQLNFPSNSLRSHPRRCTPYSLSLARHQSLAVAAARLCPSQCSHQPQQLRSSQATPDDMHRPAFGLLVRRGKEAVKYRAYKKLSARTSLHWIHQTQGRWRIHAKSLMQWTALHSNLTDIEVQDVLHKTMNDFSSAFVSMRTWTGGRLRTHTSLQHQRQGTEHG